MEDPRRLRRTAPVTAGTPGVRKLLATATFAGLANGGVAFSINSDLATAIGVLIATVTVTITVVSWIDKRIDHKIRNHATVERLQYATLLRELSNLRELGGHTPLNIVEILKESSVAKED